MKARLARLGNTIDRLRRAALCAEGRALAARFQIEDASGEALAALNPIALDAFLQALPTPQLEALVVSGRAAFMEAYGVDLESCTDAQLERMRRGEDPRAVIGDGSEGAPCPV